MLQTLLAAPIHVTSSCAASICVSAHCCIRVRMLLELVEAASCSYTRYTSPSLTQLWSLFSFRQLIAYSSVSGEGRQFLWKQIMLGLFDDDADGLTFSLSLSFPGFLSLPPPPRARAFSPLFLSRTLSSNNHARAHTQAHTLSLTHTYTNESSVI